MLADLLVLFVVELDLDLQRSSIRGITRSTFFNRILYIIRAEFKVSEFKAELPAIVLNRRYVIKSLPETVCQEPLVRVFLYFDQIRHLKHFFMPLITHADTLTSLHQANSVFFH